MEALPIQYVVFPTHGDVRVHLIVNCVVTFFLLVALAGRITARTIFGVGLWWDDGLILAALPFGLSLLFIQGVFSSLGAGHHITEVIVDVPLILRLTTAFQLLYLVALTLIKCSILCFYLRIFTDHFMVKPCRVTFGIVMLWGVAHFFAVIFICKPVQAQWDLSVTGTCGNQIKLFQSIISTNIVTDLIIIILPLYTIWHLQMRVWDKLGIMACFLIGIACVIAAIFRLVYVTAVDMVSDLTGTMPMSVFLSALEPLLAMLCACLPMLRPFYVRYKAQSSSAKLSEPSGQFESKVKGSHNTNGLKMGSGSGSRSKPVGALEMDDMDLVQKGNGFDCHIELDSRPEGSADDSGSEENLTSANRDSTTGIKVKKRWDVQVNSRS